MTTQTYCTQADLEALWTPQALLLSVDDDASGALSTAEEATIAWAIEAAASEMHVFLTQRYAQDDLVGSAWCRVANAALAVWLLAARGGDSPPAALEAQRAAVLERLADIAAGRLPLPDVVSRHEQIPTVTNFRTDLTQPHAKVRRVPETSTGATPPSSRKSFAT